MDFMFIDQLPTIMSFVSTMVSFGSLMVLGGMMGALLLAAETTTALAMHEMEEYGYVLLDEDDTPMVYQRAENGPFEIPHYMDAWPTAQEQNMMGELKKESVLEENWGLLMLLEDYLDSLDPEEVPEPVNYLLAA